MKKLIFLCAMLISFTAFSQPSMLQTAELKMDAPFQDLVYRPMYQQPTISISDTLVVPIDKYKFVKIGDKVYKINITLEEVQKEATLESIWGTTPQAQFLPYRPQSNLVLPISKIYNPNMN